MKMSVLFTCDYCGKQSLNYDEIYRCEANHLGLTVEDKHVWDDLKLKVKHINDVLQTRCDERTKIAYDEAVERLASFEKLHNIKNV